MITSRKTSDLLPHIENKALLLISECDKIGIDIIITSTYRDFEAQDALYEKGRSLPGPVVTWASAGESWHNWKRAFDTVPVINGKAVWDDLFLWHRIGVIGRKLGLEWGGDWRIKDRPHFQFTENLTLAELLKQHPKGLES